jgi:hypothetical protein
MRERIRKLRQQLRFVGQRIGDTCDSSVCERVIGIFPYGKQRESDDDLALARLGCWWVSGNDEGGKCRVRIVDDWNLLWAKISAPPGVPGSDARGG